MIRLKKVVATVRIRRSTIGDPRPTIVLYDEPFSNKWSKLHHKNNFNFRQRLYLLKRTH